MVLRTVNAVCEKRKSVKTIIIGDITNLTVDINKFRKKYRRKDLKDKDYKRAYSRCRGYYIGMKLVLAIWWGVKLFAMSATPIPPGRGFIDAAASSILTVPLSTLDNNCDASILFSVILSPLSGFPISYFRLSRSLTKIEPNNNAYELDIRRNDLVSIKTIMKR